MKTSDAAANMSSRQTADAKVSRALTSAATQKNSFLRQWNGPLTQDLLLRPGDFGLGKVPARLKPDATTRSVCGYCSTGCSLDVHLQSGVAVNLTPSVDYPVNLGMACPKGWEALKPLVATDRATTPLLRNPKTDKLEPVDWDQAMQVFTLKFKALMDQHGAESVAYLSTGQICTEEMALLGALWKFGMGALHGDSNTRQCMATAHVAYKQSFGFDAPPYTYADFEESDTLVFIGSNICIAHPIMWQRVLRNRNNPEVIVIDPRKTETAVNATQHLALQPKSDLTLLYGIANLLICNGWIDRKFIERSTSGFDEFAAFVREFTPDKVAAGTGLTVGQLYRFAETIGTRKAVSFWWTMGVNQSHESTRTAQAIINLALMTGNIGHPGTGANSITGQCNAMGSRLYANATSLLGGRDFLAVAHRAEVAQVLNIPVEKIPAKNSLAYDQIVRGIADGKIKGLWVIATNPAHSWIARGGGEGQESLTPALSPRERGNRRPGVSKTETDERSRNSEIAADGQRLSPLPGGEGQGEGEPSSLSLDAILDKLEFLVVQDMFTTTDTAKRADLILPAAGWGEKEGTFINSERRFGYIKKVSAAPGQAMSDFNIFRLVAHYWGCEGMFDEWNSPAAAFQILKLLSAGQPCDITGIEDYRHLDAEGGIQWPWTEAETRGAMEDWSRGAMDSHHSKTPKLHHSSPPKERRLFADGRFYTPDGRARFLFDPPRPVSEPVDDDYPFVLLTGRGTSAQWHTNTRTGKSAVLRTLYPVQPYVEIHPRDANRLGVAPNAAVEISSRRAQVQCIAHVTPNVQPGNLFMPMHYEVTNLLTHADFDPHSRQPSYKHCAVRITPLRSKNRR